MIVLVRAEPVANHSALNELDYESSGHTGFTSNVNLSTVSGTLQDQMDSLDYYTTAEVDTISGTLQTDIDTRALDSDVLKKDGSVSLTGNLDFNNNHAQDINGLFYKYGSVEVSNESGNILTKGTPVYVIGLDGTVTSVAKCDNTDKDKMPCIGLIKQDINHGDDGYIITTGRLFMDTTTFSGSALNSRVYVSVNGTLTTTEPTYGSVQRIGIYTKLGSSTTGRVFVFSRGRKSIFSSADEHPTIRMGSDVGHKKVCFLDYNNNEVGCIDDDGNLTISGTFIGTHTHDDRYYTESEVDTISGSLQTQIDGIGMDHGDLTGLGDDDHTQYHNNTRGDVRYYQQAEVDTISGSLSAEIDSDISINKTNYIDGPQSPQRLTGFILSSGTNVGTGKVSAGTALLRTTDSESGVLEYFNVAEYDNITITASGISYRVVLQYNSGSPQIVLQEERPNYTTDITLGKFWREPDNTTHFKNTGRRLNDGVAKLHRRVEHIRPWEMCTGIQIADEGSKLWSIAAGHLYKGINGFDFDKFDTTVSGNTFIYVYYDGADWVYVDDQTEINVDQYNNIATGLATCNKYKCDWVFIHPDNVHVYVVYGQDNAVRGVVEASSVPNVPDLVDTFGMLIGRIIIDGGQATFDEIQMIQSTTFNITTVAIHDDLSGIDGGTADEYYHLTSAQHSDLTDSGDCSIHIHDDRYYTESEIDTISGSLQTNVDEKPDTLLELSDTPDSYDVDKYLRSTADGVEWATISGTGTSDVQTFLDLTDTPTTYSGLAGRYLKVSLDESELEYATIQGTATTTISGWSVHDATTYYGDFEHNLGTEELSVFVVDTTTNKEIGVEDIEIISENKVRIYILEDTLTLKINVITGSLGTEHNHDSRYYTETEIDTLLTTGIVDDNLVQIDSAEIADNDYAKFTTSGIEGRNYSEVLEDLSGQISTTFSFNDKGLQKANLLDCGIVTNEIGSIGGGSQTIDIESGNSVSAIVDTGETTFTFNNPTVSGVLCVFSFVLTNGGSQTVNWPINVDWEGGTAPTLTGNGVDVLVFSTIDGGTVWHGGTFSLDSK
jgi:hypothetical protein